MVAIVHLNYVKQPIQKATQLLIAVFFLKACIHPISKANPVQLGAVPKPFVQSKCVKVPATW